MCPFTWFLSCEGRIPRQGFLSTSSPDPRPKGLTRIQEAWLGVSAGWQVAVRSESRTRAPPQAGELMREAVCGSGIVCLPFQPSQGHSAGITCSQNSAHPCLCALWSKADFLQPTEGCVWWSHACCLGGRLLSP